jgi:uncharacterized Zn finger protein
MTRWFPPPSRPRAVADGLKARSTRGSIAKTWWSQRFISILEGFDMGTRLQRGRNYARKGQVISIDIQPGQVLAKVQGSRAKPYQVRIGVDAFEESDWSYIEQVLAENAWYSAALLSGEMPEDVEDVFSAAGLSLFPAASSDLFLDCSCPDYALPCKHVAAVFYLLAESFDEDPFRILAWRGRERDELLANLQAARSSAGEPQRGSWQPLEECLDTFYVAPADVVAAAPVSSAPPTTLLEQLPDIGIRVSGQGMAEILRPAYDAMGGL